MFTFSCPTLKYKSYCIMSNNKHSHSPALTICQVLFFNNSEVGIVIRRSKQRGGDTRPKSQSWEMVGQDLQLGSLSFQTTVAGQPCPPFRPASVHPSVAESSQKIAVQLEGAPAQGFQPSLGLGSPSAGRWPCASGPRSWDSDQRQKSSSVPRTPSQSPPTCIAS